ncbi:tumor necrosis factor ligand superfamily member 14 [Hippocampus zosterae]|uniref:tumor necrosis factor ligand superfamily member 14 n=1 Tax=Hippocampus zosterae TaxID=109293 RepID=UPI00223CB537|nr:tumor necrosis factor ligand superfamily member 14 [Hippocampus zosterae]
MRHPRSVYLVDSHAAAAPPALPPRAGRARRCTGLAQTILFMLASVALIGLVLEALLIFYLHSNNSVQMPSTPRSKLTADKKASPHISTHHRPLSKPLARLIEKKVSPHTCTPDSKPVAHLMDGKDATHGKSVVGWSLISGRLLCGMEYKNGSLLIRREGFYFVYSKLSFHNGATFHHTVMKRTSRHPGGTVPLLQARQFSSADNKNNGNTFLGGVFHLHKDDALFVNVSDTSKILRVRAYENVFGAFMT